MAPFLLQTCNSSTNSNTNSNYKRICKARPKQLCIQKQQKLQTTRVEQIKNETIKTITCDITINLQQIRHRCNIIIAIVIVVFIVIVVVIVLCYYYCCKATYTISRQIWQHCFVTYSVRLCVCKRQQNNNNNIVNLLLHHFFLLLLFL